jgi:hypothetical protein
LDNEITSVADVNGDGARNQADVDLVEAIAIPVFPLNVLPLSKPRGDYEYDGIKDDEIVNMDDYDAWTATFGSTTKLGADGNMNGVIDAGDYTLWRDNVGNSSAWYTGSAAVPVAIPYVDFGNAPTVTNVTIIGSISTHAPHSFDLHDGSGEQLRTVPVGGADTISIEFSEDVNVEAGSLRVVGLFMAGVPTLAEFAYNIGTMTATWRFESWFEADQYLISVNDAVTDIEGNRLDGEWVNPAALSTVNAAVSEFPSGDGQAGGKFNFVMTILPGDATLNNIFTSGDTDIFEESWISQLEDALFTDGDGSGDGQANSADWYFMPNLGLNLSQLWILGDLNGDNTVDQSDVDLVMENLGMSGATWEDGDLDGDGNVDVDDLELVFAQFGLQVAVAA